jgi:hypothetical protein
MMEKASTARGSNDPPPRPPTTMDISKDQNYWNKKSKQYILDQINISGFNPPHPMNVKDFNKDELLDKLFELRKIKRVLEMESPGPLRGRPKKGTESIPIVTKRKYANK